MLPLTTDAAATAVTNLQVYTFASLTNLVALFRQAAHVKRNVHPILDGLDGAHPVLRLAASTGLVLGLSDRALPLSSRLQNHLIIALAQIMAMYTSVEWEHNSHDTLALALILSAQSLPLISPERLEALPLETLVHLLTISLVFAFNENDFVNVASLSRLTALSLSLLLDSYQGLASAQECLISLRDLAARPNPPKPLLFSTVMIADAVLSSVVYIPPSRYSEITPFTLAHTTLDAFSHMSALISDFGGVASTSSDTFRELRKTTYLALDILASSSCDAFIDQLPYDSLHQKSFALACIEQLVPALSEECIVGKVWGLVEPYLASPALSNRQVYESAHSVVLAIFARVQAEALPSPSSKGKAKSTNLAEFSTTLLPSYTQTLIQNSSSDEGLTTTQLCMAFEATVRCAIVCDSSLSLTSSILDQLIDAAKTCASEEQAHRLHLALISSLPALPNTEGLLEKMLEECKKIVLADSDKIELVQVIYKQLLERVGDLEKEVVVRWWYENLPIFEASLGDGEHKQDSEHSWGDWIRARL